MDVKALIMIVVQGSLFLFVLAIGMRSHWNDLLYAFRKPGELGRAILAVNVIVPLTACILTALLPLNWMTKAGLIVMAVSPMAPLVSGKMMMSGSDKSYDVGLYAALVLLAVIIVPLTVSLLNLFYDRQAAISIAEIAWLVTKSVLIPLAAGIAIATLWPNFAKRAAHLVMNAVYLVLIFVAVLFLAKTGRQMQLLIGDGTLIAIVGTIAVALATGHWLGGPNPGHRAALAQAAATRNPGIAGLITQGHSDSGPHAMIAVLLFLIVSVVMTLSYALWARRTLASENGSTEEVGR